MVSQSPILAFKHTENQSFQSHLILTSILDGRTDNAKSEFRIINLFVTSKKYSPIHEFKVVHKSQRESLLNPLFNGALIFYIY